GGGGGGGSGGGGGGGRSGQGMQIVHAFGRSTWEVAWQTAARFRSADSGTAAALVVEVFSAGCVDDAASMAARWSHRSHGPAVWWNAADPALAARLNIALAGVKSGAALRVTSNAWGVHVPEDPHSEIDPTRTGTMVLWCGSGLKAGRGGSAARELGALLEGLRARSESPRGLLVLANQPTADRLGLWKLARSMDLASCVSVVPQLTERWDLTLEADALVIPSTDGEQHGFVLDAMAAGMPVIARADDLASHLVDHETAVLVREPTASAWRTATSEVLDQPTRAVALGSAARNFIREKRLASAWVAGVMRLYERAVAGGSSK
ncbi:MAG: glycosyltransferase, partial [Phycisphaerales bacterium]|nr:glycosyltransferase [Phycisphaerales bacterium]